MVSGLACGVPADGPPPPDALSAEPEPLGFPFSVMLATVVLAALAAALAVGMAVGGRQRGQFPRGLLVGHVAASALVVAVLVFPVLHVVQTLLGPTVAGVAHPTQSGIYALVAAFVILLAVMLSGLRLLVRPANGRRFARVLAIAHAAATFVALALIGSGFMMM